MLKPRRLPEKLFPDDGRPGFDKKFIRTKICIHNSGVSYGDSFHLKEIWQEKGFNSHPYHFIILNGRRTFGNNYTPKDDGLIETGRGLKENSVFPYLDTTDVIDVLMIGITKFSLNQLRSVVALCDGLVTSLGIGKDCVVSTRTLRYAESNRFNIDPESPGFDVSIIQDILHTFKDYEYMYGD